MAARRGPLVRLTCWPFPFLAVATLAVLALRALYLWRFGWDAGWMNWGYLAHGKAYALRGAEAMEELPLTVLLLVLFRRLGAESLGAIGATYLASHLAFALGTLGLGNFLWPEASPRRRIILLLVVALTPLLATVAGYRNLGVLVGAATLTGALALGVASAARPRPCGWSLLGAGLLALLAASARFESLAGIACGAVVLLVLGRSLAGVHWPRLAALVLLGGAVAGSLVSAKLRHRPEGPPGASENYGFYTFYDGLPFLMWPSSRDEDEFGRYRASVRFFGTYAENGGSIARALVTHPRAALLRIAAKPVDFLGALGWPGSLTPVGLVLAALGLRGLRWGRLADGTFERGWVLLAYAGPLAVLFVPSSAPAYFLTVAPPLLLAMARGTDRLVAGLSDRAAALAGAAVALAAVLAIVLLGKKDVANSPVFTELARYLEGRCREGCLVSYLPQQVRTQAWVDLEAGSPFPVAGRAESRVLGRSDPEFERGFDFRERIRRARRSGYRGPVLYVQADIATFRAFHPDFDRELGWQGAVDLAGAREELRLERGKDSVRIYELSLPASPPP
ncbi:MAG TPA: hypothetical protein VEJ89_09145 [Myxococcaceae bacterium]|nr:hypothetical protein [Myxococcaceae bacterium]